MEISEKVKQALSETLFPLSLVGLIYLSLNSNVSLNNIAYDYRDTSSWSREEKIAYLEKQLNNPLYKSPPMMNPKTGGAIMVWSNARREKQAELEKLQSSNTQ